MVVGVRQRAFNSIEREGRKILVGEEEVTLSVENAFESSSGLGIGHATELDFDVFDGDGMVEVDMVLGDCIASVRIKQRFCLLIGVRGQKEVDVLTFWRIFV